MKVCACEGIAFFLFSKRNASEYELAMLPVVIPVCLVGIFYILNNNKLNILNGMI
jgi:hypothetical protein